ncbi:hypothetical protein GQ55_7G246800 [Panicum hallii var. hallii]|uniref:Uncharacterized protein n=1 Tax=Panicum hallii var. hallii TaxID=1504633 RepID=A0A2T7CYQ1_9POAL|nr:hypothetical protein GQ55_7G246800 [Panicum hallii var. hallii]
MICATAKAKLSAPSRHQVRIPPRFIPQASVPRIPCAEKPMHCTPSITRRLGSKGAYMVDKMLPR